MVGDMNKFKLVKIVWLDSSHPPGWLYLRNLPKLAPCVCVSVGYLIQETPLAKVIAPHTGDMDDPDNAQVDGVMIIPKKAIVSVRELKITEKEQ